jgi:hypothetical protein
VRLRRTARGYASLELKGSGSERRSLSAHQAAQPLLNGKFTFPSEFLAISQGLLQIR